MEQLREAAQVSAAIEEAGKAKAAKNVGGIKTAAEWTSYLTLPFIALIGLGLLWETNEIRKDLGKRIIRNKHNANERIESVEQTLGQIISILEDANFSK
mgnify:CR=1 FL=1|tara:strand:- start:344 stop:640 length:297 start_codon:yes stop_codon:yes gene_type:complete